MQEEAFPKCVFASISKIFPSRTDEAEKKMIELHPGKCMNLSQSIPVKARTGH